MHDDYLEDGSYKHPGDTVGLLSRCFTLPIQNKAACYEGIRTGGCGDTMPLTFATATEFRLAGIFIDEETLLPLVAVVPVEEEQQWFLKKVTEVP